MSMNICSETMTNMKTRIIEYRKEFGGWIFWDETWSDYYGPFKDEASTKIELNLYVESLMNSEYPAKEEIELFDSLKKEKV